MGIDAAINNDILAEVPIAKSIVAFCKTGVAIRDRNLLKQTELSRVIYLLDCNIDTVKSGIFARMYASYIDGEL